MMVIQHLPLEEPPAAEISAALIDLAALAQEAGSVAFEALDILARNMLRRVLALCLAQRGAVFLCEDFDVLDQSPLPSPLSAKALRALALHNVHEEEAYTLLARFPAPDEQTKSPDMTCWVTYRLTLGEGTPSLRTSVLRGLEPSPMAPLSRSGQAQQALLGTVSHELRGPLASIRGHCSY